MVLACIDGVGMEHLAGELPAFAKMADEGVVTTAAHALSWPREPAALLTGVVAPPRPSAERAEGGRRSEEAPPSLAEV